MPFYPSIVIGLDVKRCAGAEAVGVHAYAVVSAWSVIGTHAAGAADDCHIDITQVTE